MTRLLPFVTCIVLAAACSRGGRASSRDTNCKGVTNYARVAHPYAFAYPVPGSNFEELERKERECVRLEAVFGSSDALFYCCRSP